MRGLGLRPRLRGTAAPVQVPFSRTRPVSSFGLFQFGENLPEDFPY